jgi:hypothetical protein
MSAEHKVTDGDRSSQPRLHQHGVEMDKHAGEQIELIAERTPRAHPRRRRLTDATQGVLWHSCVSVLSVPAAAQGQPRCGNCKAFLPWIVDAVRRRGRRVGGRGRVQPGEGSPG